MNRATRFFCCCDSNFRHLIGFFFYQHRHKRRRSTYVLTEALDLSTTNETRKTINFNNGGVWLNLVCMYDCFTLGSSSASAKWTFRNLNVTLNSNRIFMNIRDFAIVPDITIDGLIVTPSATVSGPAFRFGPSTAWSGQFRVNLFALCFPPPA